MKPALRRAIRRLILLAAAIPAVVTGQEPQPARQEPQPAGLEPWRTVTDARLLHPEPGDWASYRRTNDVNGFSPLAQIDRSNVAQLRAVWSFSMRDAGRWALTPLVVNGLMYVAEGTGRLTAFDAATGDVVWVHDREFPKDISISQAYGRARGVAVHGDNIIWGTANSYLLAIDARTGKLVWEVKTGDYHTGEGHNHAPLVAGGRIYLGHSGGDRTARGRFRAYDAATGRLLWTFNTAPQKGDPGYETWAGSILEPKGAAPWNTASFDPELGVVYFGTGQPTPWIEGQRGTGKALYSNSIVALDAATGRYRWHFQVIPNDNWDRDSAFEPMLVDLTVGGKLRKALIHTGKNGWGVVLDRATGKYLFSFPTAYETFITGWTADGRPITDPAMATTPGDVGSDKVFTVCPHLHGARNLNAPSYSPQTGMYYSGINNTCMTTKVQDLDFEEGQAVGSTSGKAIRAPGFDYVGEFVAFDAQTGKRAWSRRLPGGAAMSASALATAGGLVFGGTVDRRFFALDDRDGRLLWQTRLNGDISGAPVSFTVRGRQYIAVTAGGRPGPTASFAPLTGTYLSSGSGVVWVFALPDAADAQEGGTVAAPTILNESRTSGRGASRSAAAGCGRAAGDRALHRGAGRTGRGCVQGQMQVCHKANEQVGASFRAKWGRRGPSPLFRYISSAMPLNKPASLPRADYAALVAYYLRESGYPSGPQPLPTDDRLLRAMRFFPTAGT